MSICCLFYQKTNKMLQQGKNESEVVQSCLTLSDPIDCSLPGYSIHGIFQVRVLEWVAIAFSWVYSYYGVLFGHKTK